MKARSRIKCLLIISVIPFLEFSCDKQGAPTKTGDQVGKKTGYSSRNNPHPDRDAPSKRLKNVYQIKEKGEFRTEEGANRLKNSINSLNDQDLLHLLDEIGPSRNTPKDSLTFTFAISELARRDPNSVMSWYSPETMVSNESGWINVAGILAESSPEILKKWLLQDLKKGSRPIQAECCNFGLMSLAEVDAASACAFARKLDGNILPNSEIIDSIFLRFGRQDPVNAEAAAKEMFKGLDLDLALYNISGGAGYSDPMAAITIGLKISDSSMRGAAISSGLSVLMSSDPSAAQKVLGELEPRFLQDALQSSPGNAGSLVNKLGKSDPDYLLKIVSNIVPSTSNQPLFRAVVTSLTANDPSKVMGFIESFPESDMKTELLGAQFKSLAAKDASEALARASTIKNVTARSEVYRNIGGIVGAKGMAATMEAASSISGSDKSALMASALPYLVSNNPKEVAELIVNGELGLDVGSRQEIVSRLGEHLCGMDATYSENWLERLPETDQAYAMNGIATEMAKSDIQGLASMLSSQKQDKNWESGVRVLIKNINTSDPAMAQKWQKALVAAGYK